ncbi:MAG: EamA family transporter RarD [Neisseria sp.]|nr:EamA family transporter RarD [Neisseria sp.]
MTAVSKGVLLCLFSQTLFGILYLFSHWMKPLGGTDVFALRMLVMAVGMWLLTAYSIGLPAMLRFVRERLGTWRERLTFAIGTANVASQFWLFMWAPVNGEGVNVATGYFLFPLVMMLAGMLWLKERPNRIQTAALFFAALGVAHEIWAVRSFSWATLWVCGVYPVYYLGRREAGVPALQGLTLDLTLILPFAAAYLLWRGEGWAAAVWHEPRYWLLLPLLGLFSALAMSANLKSGQLLPVSLFGMLSYIEPALLFLAAVFVLHTPVADSAYITYGLIWFGLLLLCINGLAVFRRGKRGK